MPSLFWKMEAGAVLSLPRHSLIMLTGPHTQQAADVLSEFPAIHILAKKHVLRVFKAGNPLSSAYTSPHLHQRTRSKSLAACRFHIEDCKTRVRHYIIKWFSYMVVVNSMADTVKTPTHHIQTGNRWNPSNPSSGSAPAINRSPGNDDSGLFCPCERKKSAPYSLVMWRFQTTIPNWCSFWQILPKYKQSATLGKFWRGWDINLLHKEAIKLSPLKMESVRKGRPPICHLNTY